MSWFYDAITLRAGRLPSCAWMSYPRTPVTTRFWIKIDEPAMARCTLVLTSDLGGGQTANVKLILAERVVRSADTWTEVDGTITLAWNGSLTGASLTFDIGRPIENVNPDFTLDDVRVLRDADADTDRTLTKLSAFLANAATSDLTYPW